MYKKLIFNAVSLIFLVGLTHCSFINASKWIIITTINQPTKAVKKLAALKDWHIVIVGDKKTPVDWHYENCVYLSPDDQMKLGFKITQLLPWNHYSRKNIGYLYAIQHGATIVYDTDDDNILIQDDISYLPAQAQVQANSRSSLCKSSVFNVYAYFGKPAMWPRGYPLDKIKDLIPQATFSVQMRPLIQQGLVDNDPDVDAIFRLTQHTQGIEFNQAKDPICLQRGTLCPFNTQNTLFHYDAFWGLLIPITTTFRVCDIWRGYWVQRLLWDIEGNLCFTPSTAIQERNDHNLLHDFIDEIDLYSKSGKLVAFLRAWQSDAMTLDARILALMQDMVHADFIKSKDYELAQAWLGDLLAVGYRMPVIKELIFDVEKREKNEAF